jgi:hypothetical protein
MLSPQKITFGEMGESGVRGVLIYCSDYTCSHSITANADPCPPVPDLVSSARRSRFLAVMRKRR